jgi:hypothetical protein
MAAGIDLSIVTAFSLGCMWASSSGQHGLKKPPKIINDDAEDGQASTRLIGARYAAIIQDDGTMLHKMPKRQTGLFGQ